MYFGFILLVAYNKPLLGRIVVPGLSLGILLGALVIVAAWVLIWIYVRWANTHYDAAIDALRGRISDRRLFFFIFIALSLGITYVAARRTRSAEHFYTAGGSVTGLQNGLALAGDYMSAASFLGIAGLVALSGFDGLIYSIGFLVGWPVVMFLIAEPLRNLGKYTFADVVAFRLRQAPVRVAAAIGSLAVVAFYLIAQMVGAGNLIRLLFGLQYEVAVVIVGVGDAGLRAVRRHDGDDVGADHQGRAAAERRVAAGDDGAVAVRLQPARAVRGGGGPVRRGGARRRAGWSRTRSTRCRSGSR